MSIGVTTLVLPREWSLDETLERITKAGYQSVEFALRDTGYCSIETSKADLPRLKTRAKAAGVELSSICPAVRSQQRNLLSPDVDLRNESLDSFRTIIEIADAMEVETILVVPGRMSAEVFYDDAYLNALEGMRTLAQTAEKYGINLAIEYVWNDFLLSPVEFARFCDEVDSPRVGFYFDSGNMVHTGYPDHWVRICARHLMAVHLKDFRRKDRAWTPLMEGDVDFKAVMAELRAMGYNGDLISEVEPSIASLESTAKAIMTISGM